MLNDLYKQRQELQRQLTIVDHQIQEQKVQKEKQKYETLCNCHKKSFIKDIKMFNDVSINIKFGTTLKTPHYKIEFTDDGNWWKAGITDLHTNKYIVNVCMLKQEVKTIRQSLDDISETIVDYEVDNNFKGVG